MHEFMLLHIRKDPRIVVRMMERAILIRFLGIPRASCRGSRSTRVSIPLEPTSRVMSSHTKPAALTASMRS